MDSVLFQRILDERITSITNTLSNKAKEYAIGNDKVGTGVDRLYNFKRAGEILRVATEKALLGMLMKHLVSVIDLVEGSIDPSPYMVDEKIGDAINYLILLEAIFKEKHMLKQIEKVNMDCLSCGECSNGKVG
jgi:hypothetical protein